MDLHTLPKVRDSWSFLYAEHCRIEQEDKAIAIHDKRGRTPVPCASLTTLVLGPGTTITHAAVRALAANGCLVVWSGEDNVRFYALGMGETRSAANMLHQARMWADQTLHLQVVRRLYEIRFEEPLPRSLTLRQIRGREGMRVRKAYADASAATGVPWQGRSYRAGKWHQADYVNRALSSPTATSTASATRRSSLPGSPPRWASFTPARCSPSCMTSPTCTRPLPQYLPRSTRPRRVRWD